MRPLKRLKEIIHSNIQTDETNQNENGNRVEERDTESVNKDDAHSDSFQESEEEYEIIEREILPEKIICPDCGGITLEGLDFCDKCGGELHIYNR